MVFSYELPRERVATRPLALRESAKMICWDGKISHSKFSNLPNILRRGDLLVLNNSTVKPYRLHACKNEGKEVEVLLLPNSIKNKDSKSFSCQALIRGKKSLKLGETLKLKNTEQLVIEVIDLPQRSYLVDLNLRLSGEGIIEELLQDIGSVPIPPYIRDGKSDDRDKDDYQNVFRSQFHQSLQGSIAAPTAGLHFSKQLLSDLTHAGVNLEYITLDVGISSFLPVTDSRDKKEFEEKFFVSEEVLARIEKTKKDGGRVIGVGTTVVRALESIPINEYCECEDGTYLTKLFIQPGFDFKVLDGIITNFHQPKTTHLLLVEAFIGYKALSDIYQQALENSYRFLSYGDGMLLWHGGENKKR